MLSVVLGMFLCAVLPLINAGCFNMEHKTTVKFCQDTTDNTWHPTGSVWRNSKCFDCNCSADSMRCCDTFSGFTIYRYMLELNEHFCFILLTADDISPKIPNKHCHSEHLFAENDSWSK
uniref:Beta-microseminoprotein n=1 Tax=Sinocyclocheilus rhinocerous TaxID=307959 RepID=A0A673H9R6_9TELE